MATYGVITDGGPLWWPAKAATETLIFTDDMTLWLAASAGDAITAASATIPWAVSGDAQVTALAVTAGLVAITIKGGFPGRYYAVMISGSTRNGNTFEKTVYLPIRPAFLEAGEALLVPPATTAGTVLWP